MKREFNPRRLDVAEFARAGAELQGEWALTELGRLAAEHRAAAASSAAVAVGWHALGEWVERRAAAPQAWLHLEVHTEITRECQRCLSPVTEAVTVKHSFRFVDGEAQAERDDADSDEDVLALTRALDLRELAEDELLLALSLVPRHEICPQALAPDEQGASDAVGEERRHPFAVLAALRRK